MQKILAVIKRHKGRVLLIVLAVCILTFYTGLLIEMTKEKQDIPLSFALSPVAMILLILSQVVAIFFKEKMSK